MFNIERKTLFEALKAVVGAADAKNPLAILGNVLIELKNNQLHLTGTDNELMIQASVDMPCDTLHAVTVPAKKLMDIVRNLPDKAIISFTQADNDKVVIKANKSKFSVGCLPAEDYPAIESQSENAIKVTIAKEDLIDAFASTAYCMGVQDVRYYLNGLCMTLENDNIIFVSTDGHRLVKKSFDNTVTLEKPFNAIIPRKAVLELQKLLPTADACIEVFIESKRICFKLSDSLQVSSKLIDARFPDYNSVIPKENNLVVIVDINAFKQALSRVAILSNERFKGVRFTLQKDVILLSSRNNPGRDEAEEEVECKYDGVNTEIGFNAQYLLDALAALPYKAGLVCMQLREDANSAVLIKPVIEGDASLQAVIMPMRL